MGRETRQRARARRIGGACAALLAGSAMGMAEEPTWSELEARALAPVEPPRVVAPPRTVIVGATVLTATGDRLEDGWVLLEEGRIASLGEGSPPDAVQVVDATGRYVTPGLIDTHSHLGVYPSPGLRAHSDGNEMTHPTTPGVWAEHAVWPQDPGFERAVRGGVTTLQILPGSANLVGGRGVVMRPLPARGSRAMRFPGAPETVKMACGENPKRVYRDKGGPSTRMGNVRGHRAAFQEAVDHLADWQAFEEAQAGDDSRRRRKGRGKPPEPPHRDLDLDTLVGILDGRFLPQVHCYRADDMLAVLQVADEFGFEVRSFHHAVEAYKIRDILAEREVSVSTWSDWWGFKAEAYDAVLPNAALVHEAGGRAVIHSDSAIGIQRLNQEASKAYHDGLEAGIELTEDDALRWITAHAAWTLGIEDETGTLEPGKRADVVVWSAHPLSVYAEAERVFIDGRQVLGPDQGGPWSDFERGQEVTR